MKIGVSAFAWTTKFGHAHIGLLPKIREHGLAGFEIPMFDPASLATSDIRGAFDANDLECTICAILPAGINPISPDASVRKKSVAHLVQCVETSADLGAHLMGGPLLPQSAISQAGAAVLMNGIGPSRPFSPSATCSMQMK